MIEEQHRKVSLEVAARHFAKKFSQKPFRHIRQLFNFSQEDLRKRQKNNPEPGLFRIVLLVRQITLKLLILSRSDLARSFGRVEHPPRQY